mmetsp:Transcript_22234/g.88244  ORF Transcript_22234/g.88244 Transcript_22234/m.88244 type:complete len:224 (+) Transcript_22234:689-1360(+)
MARSSARSPPAAGSAFDQYPTMRALRLAPSLKRRTRRTEPSERRHSIVGLPATSDVATRTSRVLVPFVPFVASVVVSTSGRSSSGDSPRRNFKATGRGASTMNLVSCAIDASVGSTTYAPLTATSSSPGLTASRSERSTTTNRRPDVPYLASAIATPSFSSSISTSHASPCCAIAATCSTSSSRARRAWSLEEEEPGSPEASSSLCRCFFSVASLAISRSRTS